MGCLYCGKEIGPFRLLLDGEFCKSSHRKCYGARLGKVIDPIADPEPRPVRTADFLSRPPFQQGCVLAQPHFVFGYSGRKILIAPACPVAVPAVCGSTVRPLVLCKLAPPRAASAAGGEIAVAAVPPRLAGWPLGVTEPDPPETAPEQTGQASAPCDRWGPGLAPVLAPKATPLTDAYSAGIEVAGPANERSPAAKAPGIPSVAHLSQPVIVRPSVGELQSAPAEPICALAVLQGVSAPHGRPAPRLPDPAQLDPVEDSPVQSEGAPVASAGWLPDPPIAAAPSLAPWMAEPSHPVVGSLLPAPVSLWAATGVMTARGTWRPALAGPVGTTAPPRAADPFLATIASHSPGLANLAPVADEAEGVETATPECDRWMIAPVAAAAPPAAPQVAGAVPPASPCLPDPENLQPVAETPVKREPPSSPAPIRWSDPPASRQPGFAPADLACMGLATEPAARLEWCPPKLGFSPPRFGVRPLIEVLNRRTVDPGKRSIAVAFSRAGVPKPKLARPLRPLAIRALAASLLAGALLWYGAGMVRTGTETVAQNTVAPDYAAPAGTYSGRAPATASSQPSNAATQAPAAPPKSSSLVARAMRAVAGRASVAYSDTFHSGMEAWGSAPHSLIPGWSRHRDGYIQPGQLALYHPTVPFTDYRLEFFGQVENRGMDWVVRAHDRQNYYAMKVAVVEPGARPLMALVHYTVVGGKAGRRVAVPLSAMLHNDTPYHISVDVNGDRVTTLIEGEQVDSWIDSSLKSGGVGFFSEAGDRARLYWMRVSKNQDFLGRVCRFLSAMAGEKAQSAQLWDAGSIGPASGGAPAPDSADSAQTAAEAGVRGSGRSPRARTLKDQRLKLCGS